MKLSALMLIMGFMLIACDAPEKAQNDSLPFFANTSARQDLAPSQANDFFTVLNFDRNILSATPREVFVIPKDGSSSFEYQFLYRYFPRFPQSNSEIGVWIESQWSNVSQFTIPPLPSGTVVLHLKIRSTETKKSVFDQLIGYSIIMDLADLDITDTKYFRHLFSSFTPPSIDSTIAAIKRSTSAERAIAMAASTIESQADILKKKGLSKQQAIAIASTFVIAELWHFGNRYQLNASGCSVRNEESWKKKFTFEEYISDKIGCCTDYVLMQMAVLNSMSYPTKIVQLSEHFLIETELYGAHWLLDPTTGLVIFGDMATASDSAAQMKIISIELNDVSLLSDEYRERRGQARQLLIAKLLHGGFAGAKYVPVSIFGQTIELFSGKRKGD